METKETITIEGIIAEMTSGMDDALSGFEYGGISGADYFRQKLRQSLHSLLRAKASEIAALKDTGKLTSPDYAKITDADQMLGYNAAIDQAAAILQDQVNV